MWKQIGIGGAVAAAIVGVGTAAVATSGSTTTPGAPAPAGTAPGSTSSSAPAHPNAGKAHGKLPRELRGRVQHGQFVTQDPKTKQFVTHDVIRGSVTAVSPTSITVKAADNVSETFVVNSSTHVRERENGKGTASSIGAVKVNDTVEVAGTGAPSTATVIVDGAK